MGAEAVWWRCHRRLIADYAMAAGLDVMHILSADRTEPAHMTEGANVGSDGRITYPGEQGELFAPPACGDRASPHDRLPRPRPARPLGHSPRSAVPPVAARTSAG